MNIFKRFSKFGIVGILNTIIDIAIFNIFVFIGLHPGISNIISTFVAMINSYIFNKKWTFKEREGHSIKKEIFLFFSLTSLGILINTLLVTGFYELILLIDLSINQQIIANIAKILAGCLTLIYNFFVYNKIVFKNKD